jgi:hypothetical protein
MAEFWKNQLKACGEQSGAKFRVDPVQRRRRDKNARHYRSSKTPEPSPKQAVDIPLTALRFVRGSENFDPNPTWAEGVIASANIPCDSTVQSLAKMAFFATSRLTSVRAAPIICIGNQRRWRFSRFVK